jgi:hypothetical protein
LGSCFKKFSKVEVEVEVQVEVEIEIRNGHERKNLDSLCHFSSTFQLLNFSPILRLRLRLRSEMAMKEKILTVSVTSPPLFNFSTSPLY